LIDSHALADVVDIERIPAVFRNQTIDQGDLSSDLNEAPSQCRANKAKAAGDKDIGSSKNRVILRHSRIVGRGQKDFL
jgi:hypothetical protein